MRSAGVWIRFVGALLLCFGPPYQAAAHPLRLSLSEIEYASDNGLLTISLRLFLMDVNQALVFDPESTELAFCQPNESEAAEPLLMAYLDEFFYIKANGQKVPLEIKSKKLHGDGINEAIGVVFEHRQAPPLTSLEIKNAVFTDLFFDQNNIVYVHIDGKSTSLMLNKKTPTHTLEF
ncbi:MAG: DUF6702 family protein [Pseudomonadota bacterium]